MIPMLGPDVPSGVFGARNGFASHASQAMNPSSSKAPFRLGPPELEGAPSFAYLAKGGLLRSNFIVSPLLVHKEVES